ncbi:putative leucine-rich repeat receptor-like serine/threonine-protein kinase At2g24130 [Magnolia sinica]|uniref:putative leucine-rich repeat receptor-like serine/threonine-protein kinase At2g24130 n=1 Tax=Magnolia sinica TaxID=86752 RepID=UPI0026593E6F|nr:putative leucine-rich repeat receptor-like serine/threonine-protein kinase At2g24130 [Magnolia sinica]
MAIFGSVRYPNLLHLIIVINLFFILIIGSSEHEKLSISTDRASLLSFISQIVVDPDNALQDWNSSRLHVCNWTGVTCSHVKERVTQLDLSKRSLHGTISPALGNLSFLVILDLSGNFFRGRIPVEIGALSHLSQLSFESNLLEGETPAELGFLCRLVYLDLGSNRLVGRIPATLFHNTSSLQYIDLSNNSLTGKIPLSNQCKLTELRFLLLWSNHLVGPIPPSLSNSTKLEWIDLGSNSLSGELPAAIFDKLPCLQFLYLSYNNLASHDGNTNLRPFFASLLNCSRFQELELVGNNLGGEIPSIVGDLSTSLLQLQLGENRIYGSIPPSISTLVNLTLLNLSSNLLNGSIPLEVGHMGKLERVFLSNNSLYGEIPSTLGEIPHLGLLDLSKNRLSGLIPDALSNLSQLRRLLLYENHFSGTIPPSLGKCINLEILDLSHNRLTGMIPREVARLRSLTLYLNLSSNFLQGPLPLELSKMDMVLAIDLSSNNLSGRIPPQLGSCIALEYLNLSRNLLQGPLPISIGNLPYLQVLDLSSNRLKGEIPASLQASTSLKQLNCSFNNFSGFVWNEGAFASLALDSFLGNSGLCGSFSGMSSCHKKRHHRFIILSILLTSLGTPCFVLCIFGYLLVLKLKTRQSFAAFHEAVSDDEEQQTKEHMYPRISYRQLSEATGGFNGSSLIGSGRFGHVYKGILHDETKIAVKVMDSECGGDILGSFKRECQVLKRTRHRNLIKIITACSRPDFKALILPLMSNGSLESHLYPNHGAGRSLSLIQLVNICRDIAEGMAYLHHHSPVRVIHCDLKPSNVLLDDDMTALVTDFGIAKLVIEGGGTSNAVFDSSSFSSTAGLLCGSIGYIAPEYGMGKHASTKGDVYSFGVLLLEVITGKRPTDVIFQSGSSMHAWVKSHYPHKLDSIIEQALQQAAPSDGTCDSRKVWREVIMELIELGLICTQRSPSARPTMIDVAHEMGQLKEYLGRDVTFEGPWSEGSSG